jgi:hypothetical protein
MADRITPKRVEELRRWLKRNKDATWQTFVKETGGTQSQYYRARIALGYDKNKALSDGMKAMYKRKKTLTLIIPKGGKSTVSLSEAKKQTEEFAKPTATEVVTEGVTPDFIWYEIDLIQRKLSDVSTRLAHVMKVSQGRDADQKKMMQQLITENTELRVNNSSLSQQVAELTEMINGTPV